MDVFRLALVFINDLFFVYYHWLKSVIKFFVPISLRRKDVTKDIVLITGGGSGLGRILAIKFAKLGSITVVWDINENGLKETQKLVKKFGGRCYSYVCDISNRQNVYLMADKVKNEVGNVTILINNAGVVYGKSILQLNDEEIMNTFNVNTLSHFWTIKSFLPSMSEMNRGHIVSISSVASFAGVPSLSDYVASKYATVGLMESLMLEAQFQGFKNIECTTVCPYYMNTGMFAGVKSAILPVLEPEYVANEVMKAILTNQKFVFVPKFLQLLYPLKILMPLESYPFFVKLLKAENTMQTFVGRNGSKSK